MTILSWDMPEPTRRIRVSRAESAYRRAWGRIERQVRHVAGRMTDDRDLKDDLVQEAMVLLWDLDPTRFDLRRREDNRYVMRLLSRRMRTVWRREWTKAVRDPLPSDGLVEEDGEPGEFREY
jgi:DNA-directed RNA polymerase specialized sigma24 family protein